MKVSQAFDTQTQIFHGDQVLSLAGYKDLILKEMPDYISEKTQIENSGQLP